MRTALRWAFLPAPARDRSAARATSPDALVHANWKASLGPHMFSPPPVRVWVRVAASNAVEPGGRTAPTSPRPRNGWAGGGGPPDPAPARQRRPATATPAGSVRQRMGPPPNVWGRAVWHSRPRAASPAGV